MNGTFDFSGKVALVACVDGAIGRAAVTRLALGGAEIAVITRDAHSIEAWLAPLARLDKFLVLEHEIALEEEVARCVGRVLDAYGRIDLLLIDTQGSSQTSTWPASIGETKHEDFDAVLASCARPAFLALKHGIPAIARGSGGAVVCISSVLGSKGYAGRAAHVAAHHAINGMAIVAAKEWAGRNIRVNAVAPASDVALSGAQTFEPEDSRPGFQDLADEAAALAAFLLSDDASYLTGAIYSVDRGDSTRIPFD